MGRFLKTRYVLCAFFVVLNFWIYGYTYGANSYQAQDLPLIHRLMDPSLYPDDLFVDTIDQFPSLYIYFMAGLARFVPLPMLHFLLFMALVYLLFLAIYELAILLFKDRAVCFWVLMLFSCSPIVNVTGFLGGEPLMPSLLYHGSFTVPFSVWVLVLFLRRRFISAFLIVSFIVYFNALMAAHLMILLVCGTFVLWQESAQKERHWLMSGWTVCGILILPFIKGRLLSSAAGISADFPVFLYHWHPEHYFCSTWPSAKWIFIAVYLLFFVSVFIKERGHSRHERVVSAFFVAIFLMWIASAVFSEIFPLRSVIILQFFRSDMFLLLFGLLYAARYLKNIADGAWVFRFPDSAAVMRLCVPVVAVIFLTDLRLLNADFYPILFAVFWVIWLITSVPGQKLARLIEQRRIRMLNVLIMIAATLSFWPLMRYRLVQRSLSNEDAQKKDWHALQLWAARATAPQARFITPPYLIGFRTFSKRGTFVERLDGGAGHWAPGVEKKWDHRLRELGYHDPMAMEYDGLNPDAPRTKYAQSVYAALTENDFQMLRENYQIDYVVQESFRSLSFLQVYRNDHYVVYKIENRE